jgi:hypothetical protein
MTGVRLALEEAGHDAQMLGRVLHIQSPPT